MSLDPLGYYARLGVAPDAASDEVKAAFLRQARRLHPDVPGTGDPEAFVRLKEAYDVVSSPLRRAAYRRAALAGTASPPPTQPARPARTIPLWMLNPALRSPWLAAIGGVVLATAVAIVLLVRAGGPDPRPAVAPIPSPVAEAQPEAQPQAPPPALAGAPDHYVLPASGPATVWQGDPAGGPLTSDAALPAFAPVHVPPGPAPEGLLPVALAGGGVGFVDATRLMPGDALAARRASCAYLAGRPPSNGEALSLGIGGTARATLANASSGPAVVTLRDRTGALAARIYLAPRGAARVAGLPAGPWTAEVAFGELWSRACTAFVAGERVARAPAPVPPGGTLTIGPNAPNG